MKNKIFRTIGLSILATAFMTSCSKEEQTTTEEPILDFSGTYLMKDQMARPAINTVFIAAGTAKDVFNNTIPSMQGDTYQPIFQARLLALNPDYTTNALTFTAAQLSGALATDILTVKKTGVTTFFDGTNVLTGRALADDVISTELLLIFGGPTGTEKPGLTDDHVNTNDKPFLTSFPYLAAAW